MKRLTSILLCLCFSALAWADNIEITATQTSLGCTLDVGLLAEHDYTGFQMDLTIDGAYSLSSSALDPAYDSFSFITQQLSSGNIRLLAYSDGTSHFASGTSTLLSLNLSGEGEAVFKLKNIRFTKSDGAEVIIPNVTANFTILPPPTFTLTFLVDGEIFSSSQLSEGDPVDVPNVPEREGYTFSWQSEIPATMPAEDLEISGTYSVNSYNLTFLIDGEVFSSSLVPYGSEITPPDAPEKPGLTFTGWDYVPATMPAHDVEVTGSYSIAEGVDSIKSQNTNASIHWYSASGLRLPASPTQRGIYIKNSKKVLKLK